jgi:precorrin-2 dehydrogenase / sirohydrochlorin ferrochelatase
MTAYYMVCLDLQGKDCLVVGGGRVATEKAAGLVAAGASVTAVAPEVDDELTALPVEVARRPFTDSDVVGRFLVIAATNDRLVNRRVSSAALEHNTPCNVADDPELCSFILPAIVREGPIVAGVSTGGASPALAQHLRSEIAERIRPEHAELAERLAALRPWVKEHFATYDERRRFFQAFVAEVMGA